MQLFASVLVALCSTLVAAAPTSLEARTDSCELMFFPNGTYQDSGCGTIIQPKDNTEICIASYQDVKEGNKLFMTKCSAGKETGSRFLIYSGSQQLRFMQAKSYEYCMQASEDRKSVSLQKCDKSNRLQFWYTNGSRLNLAGENYCITTPEEGLGHGVVLKECDHCQGQKLQIGSPGGSGLKVKGPKDL